MSAIFNLEKMNLLSKTTHFFDTIINRLDFLNAQQIDSINTTLLFNTLMINLKFFSNDITK